MTECERIIEQGILPKSFFEPETICDFYVDEKRKKIWAVELDLLLELDRVCKKHGLKYYLFFGTLLGAVRHKGFIPWDDDIDVVMPRDDYEELMKMGLEFNSPYFLQTPYTDPEYFYSYIKIRNGNTTGLSKKFMYNSFNHGIFLDVFPLDDINEQYTDEVYDYMKKLIVENSTYMKRNNPFLNIQDRIRVANNKNCNPLKKYEEIQRIATSFRNINSRSTQVSTVVVTAYSKFRSVYEVEDFSRTTLLDYLGYKFPAPIGYDRVLTTNYGDYKTIPPLEQRGVWHEDLYFDPDIDYLKSIASLLDLSSVIE